MTPTLPVAVDTERLVLGSVILNGAMMHEVRPVVEAEDFSLDTHQRIWRRCCELYDAGEHVDRITVYNALEKQAKPEGQAIGGHSYLNSLEDGLPLMADVSSYVAILKDFAARRKIMSAGHVLMGRAASGEAVQSILDSMGVLAQDLAVKEAQGGLRSVGEVIDAYGVSQVLAPRKDRGLLFPWPWMNYSTSGMLPAELWILAGHTSTGKTSAMLQHAVHAARHGTGVAIFSLEVGDLSLTQKMMYQLSRVDSERGKRNELDAEERQRQRVALSELAELPLYMDTQCTTPMAIHAAVRKLRLKRKVDHVIVDYLQLLGNSGRHDNRAQAVGANAWALKILATDFKIPVLVLSQFSRASNKPGQQREPELTDLKETGDIENHANGVWFLHRVSNEDSNQIPVKFILPKQRDGRRNIYRDFMFLPQYQRFEEIEQ